MAAPESPKNIILHENNPHSRTMGYLLWLFGFMGAHRFYYGRPISATIWLFTLGLLGIGWVVDLFLIPQMDRECDFKYKEGVIDYNISWVLLTFLGVLGIHKFYQGKILWGILYFFTAGLAIFGLIYDFWTLNEQVNKINLGHNR